MNRWVYYGVICLIATIVFFSSNHFLRGYLGSKEGLGKELQTAPDSLYEYKLIQQAPFKYRLLFPAIIKTSNSMIFGATNSDGFYITYKVWSYIFFSASACLLFYLLILNDFSGRMSLVGAVIFLLLPPAFMAYTVPVHTREDPLAYCILFSGLIFLLLEFRWVFMITTIIGVLCRETLLLLPLLYFFFSRDPNTTRKLFISAVPCMIWISLRLFMTKTPYDPLEGFHWNNQNPDQVVGFLLLTYNLLWLPLIFSWLSKPEVVGKRKFFFTTSWLTIGVILLTTYFGGIYNEIRLLFLASPWLIVISLDFLERHKGGIVKIMKTLSYCLYIAACFVGFGLLMFFLLKYQSVLIKPGKYHIPYHLWIIVSTVYFMVAIIFTPAFIRVFLNKR